MKPTRPVARGCGKRRDGGLYACVGTSPDGLAIEHFIIDPSRPWEGGPFRAPQIVPVADHATGEIVHHLLIWIGEAFYATVPDYVEESRRFGISRRVPKTIDLAKLTPGKSKMFLVHPKAIPTFPFDVIPTGQCRKPDVDHLCTFHDWPLSAIEPETEDRKLTDLDVEGRVRVQLPSFEYEVVKPAYPTEGPQPYQPGLFAAFWLTHFEFISQSDQTKNDPTIQKVKDLGWQLKVMDE